MLVKPRSSYTAILPKAGTVGDVYKGLNFFNKKPTNVNFTRLPSQLVYVHKDPGTVLDSLLREAQQTHLSDLNYNYAIAQNVAGIFTVRGGLNKCSGSEDLEVLMLLGQDEAPTDLLKENQTYFENLTTVGLNSVYVPKAQIIPGQADIHVFDLIEVLAAKGYYQGRNDGVYGPFTEQAVFKLQVAFDHPEPNGIYDHKTYNYLKQNG